MTLDQFIKLGQQGCNHVPVVRQLFADFETPLSCYVKVARGPYSYLLESAAQGGEKWARYSVVGLPCRRVVKINGSQVTVREDGIAIDQFYTDDPLGYIEDLQKQFTYPDIEDLPIYTGGLMGYFGYDTVRYTESRIAGTVPEDTLGTPDILLMISNDVLVFDNVLGRIHIITHADPKIVDSYRAAQSALDDIVEKLRSNIPHDMHVPEVGPKLYEADFVSSYGEDSFISDVEKIKKYILAGDVMQVVLSQRLSVSFESDPLNLYRALRSLNPSPYMYFVDMEDFQIVSSSPEILARLDNGEVTVRPLAGTRRRGVNESDDLKLEQELLSDSKEIAEHLMLIDLGRNDIGKVCKAGTVEVSEMMVVEKYAHVMHIASNVRGKIREELGAIDLLRSTLPVGTLSGAPKVRAMEIIDELEPEKRGIFGGAVGYLSWNGNMDTAIAIRTAIIQDNKLYVQAGAGVVADSIPELEWQETMNKTRSIIQASAMAEAGLDLQRITMENERLRDRTGESRIGSGVASLIKESSDVDDDR